MFLGIRMALWERKVSHKAVGYGMNQIVKIYSFYL